MAKANPSGTIVCAPSGVEYTRGKESWCIAFDDIAAIGECTNELGPFADDYFICFVDRNGKRWLLCSFYADGRDELMVRLSAYFGTPFEFGLCDSTSFKSRVMWPESLRDEPLFEYLEPPPRNRFTAWLRRIGVKPSSNLQVLAPNVQTLVSRAVGL